MDGLGSRRPWESLFGLGTRLLDWKYIDTLPEVYIYLIWL